MPYIKITEEFIKNFLSPMSNIVDRGGFHVNDGVLSTCSYTTTGLIICSMSMNIDSDLSNTDIFFSDVSRLRNLLDSATDLDDEDKLTVTDNALTYKSSKWRFKYHLLDDSIGTKVNFNTESIKNFNIRTSFIIDYESIRDIVKLRANNKMADKVYFNFSNGAVTATVTDRAIANIDEMCVKVADSYEGEDNNLGCPVYFEIIKILSQHRGASFKIKYNGSAFLMQTICGGVNISYVVSEVTN